jgi:glycosyltransferase involved in cell wall biosynthesis
MSKKISIILPAYNSLEYLPQAVKSILAQDYTNFELIVVNDGSKDGTNNYLRGVRDSRLKIIDNESNIGITKSLNKAIENATGDYIARMDADDIALPSRLRLQLSFLESNDYDVVSSTAQTLNKFPRRIFGMPLNDQELKLCLFFFNPIVHPLVFGKTSIFKRFPYVKEYEWAEDYFLWTKMAMNNVRIGVDSTPLLLYRLHSGQVSVSKQETQIALTDAVARNYYNLKSKEVGGDANLREENNSVARLRFALSNLVLSEAISARVKGRILRHIHAAEINCWLEYRQVASVYKSFGADFHMQDGVVAMASVLGGRFKSTLPSRIAKRLI